MPLQLSRLLSVIAALSALAMIVLGAWVYLMLADRKHMVALQPSQRQSALAAIESEPLRQLLASVTVVEAPLRVVSSHATDLDLVDDAGWQDLLKGQASAEADEQLAFALATEVNYHWAVLYALASRDQMTRMKQRRVLISLFNRQGEHLVTQELGNERLQFDLNNNMRSEEYLRITLDRRGQIEREQQRWHSQGDGYGTAGWQTLLGWRFGSDGTLVADQALELP